MRDGAGGRGPSRGREPAVDPEAPHSRLALAAIMLSSMMLGATLSFSVPLLSLVLEGAGVAADLIGLNAAAGGLAAFVAAPFLPRTANRLGAVPSIVFGLLLAIVCLSLFPLSLDLWLWAALRFGIGLGTALAWVASESAINALAQDHNRGRVLGVYATLFCVGYASGPLLIPLTGTEGALPFLVAAGILAVGLPPLALARGVDRAMAAPATSGLLTMFVLAPLALGAALAYGLVETSMFALFPLYALDLGANESRAALLLAVFVAGNIALQIPIGWCGDRAGRARVLQLCCVFGAGALLVLPVAMTGSTWLLLPLLFVTGGVLGALYVLSLALLGERFRGQDLAVANTAFVLAFQSGSMVGPPAAGGAMETLGPDALPLVLAGVLMIFLGATWARQGRRVASPSPGRDGLGKTSRGAVQKRSA